MSIKCNIFGDCFIKKLGASLRRSLGIEVLEEVTVNRATINGLRRKLTGFYENRKTVHPEVEEWCVIMVGTYNVMSCGHDNVWKASQRLKKELSVLIALLERHNNYIILLTALPLVKMDGKRHYWQLLRMYNKQIRRLSTNPKIVVVDLFPIFTEKRISLTCNENYYDKAKSGVEEANNQVWNTHGMERALRKILEAGQGSKFVIVDTLRDLVKDLEGSFTDGIANSASKGERFGKKCLEALAEIMRGEKCLQGDGLSSVKKLQFHNICNLGRQRKPSNNKCKIMGTTLENVDIKDENPECKPVGNIAQTNIAGSCGNIKTDNDVEGSTYSRTLGEAKETGSPVYECKTVSLLEGLRERLSSLRIQEYSNYGKELLNENKIKSIENELVTVATYNVLSQDLLEKHRHIYMNHDQGCLNWKLRREILREEFTLLNADILCLQEVDFSLLDPIYTDGLYDRGYEGVHKKKTHGKTDGCAIYFKSSKFNLVESLKVELYRESVKLLDRDNIGIILKLSLRDRPEIKVVVATTHLLYNPKRADLKLVQTQLMLAEIERFAFVGVNPTTGETDYLPIIFTGDMNYYPGSAGYELVTKSYFEYAGKPNKYLLPFTEGRILDNTLLPAGVGITDSCQYLSSICTREGPKSVWFESGSLAHPLNLSSVYSHVKDDYPEATTNQDKWVTADYIFYSQSLDPERNCRVDGSLKLVSKLTLPNSKEAETELVNIPNLACGSDHLPLLATFHVTGPE